MNTGFTPIDRWAVQGRSAHRSADAINRDAKGVITKSLKDVYAELARYYSNDAFDILYSSSATGQQYRQARGIYNPTKRVCDWYAHRLYPGPWTSDGLPLPDGSPAAIPFSDDTEEEVRLASMAAMEWGNFDERRTYYVRLGAIYADVAIKPVLDVEAGKVYPIFIEPEYVTDLTFNARGDVIAYRLEIPQRENDEWKTPYVYGEIGTKESFTTLKDGRPWSYEEGVDAVQPNPFGFCPFVWVRHSYVGGIHGAPAIDGVIRKIDELNRIVTSAHDFIEKLSKQPIGVASDKPWKTTANADGVHWVNGGYADSGGRTSTGVFKGPADLRVFPLIQDIGLGPSLEWARQLIDEIENDLPEVTMDQELRKMNNVAGVAIPRLMGDVAARYYAAQRAYDAGLVTAMQMLISMGSYAAKSGLWRRPLTETQQLFLPFDLASYDRGRMDISLMTRPLIHMTPQERAEIAMLREKVTTPQGLREAGYSDEEIFGEDAVPDPRPGILDERRARTSSVADALGSAMANGAVR